MTTTEQEKRLVCLKNKGMENITERTIEFRRIWNEIEKLKRKITILEEANKV